MKVVFLNSLRAGAVLICLLCVILFSGCAEQAPDFELLQGSFCCDVSWKSGDTELFARAYVESAGDGKRDILISFTSPELFSEMTLKREQGREELCFDGIPMSDAACEEYMKYARLLAPSGGFEYSCRQGELDVYCDGQGSLWYFKQGIPIKIEGKDRQVKILNIEGQKF